MAAEYEAATTNVLEQVFEEYGGRMKVNGSGKILVSDANVARAVHKATEDVRTSYGPTITIVKRGIPGEDAAAVEGIATYKALDQLEVDHYSHAFFGISGEDPKYILQGMKSMIFAMAPKGIAVVVSVKVESKAGDDGQVTVSLEDKMKYQSKGKIEHIADVMEYAGFEKGKIRSFEKTSNAGGKKVEADVVLAIKWDQLTG